MLRYVDMLSVDAPIILGVRLKPLSLGHILHMQANDCIFISPLKVRLFANESPMENLKMLNSITLELLLAITICSMSYEEFNDMISDGDVFTAHMKKWSKVVNKLVKRNQVNILESIGLFNQYILNGYAAEKLPYEDLRENPTPSGQSDNWPHTVIAALCAEMNYTRTEILNQSLNVSLIDYFKLAERNGLIHLQSDEEYELVQAAIGKKDK